MDGRTQSGKVIDDQVIEELADEAERGYDPALLRNRPRGRGRPPLGDAAKTVESVRLEGELRDQAAQRAAEEGITVSEVTDAPSASTSEALDRSGTAHGSPRTLSRALQSSGPLFQSR
jgi:hypothetical protein